MILAIAVNEALAQDSERATDLQWLRFICFSKKQIYLTDSSISEDLQRYPHCEDYDRTGSFIRNGWNAMRGVMAQADWPKKFWLQCHKNTPCWTRHEQEYRGKIKRDRKSIEDMMDIEKLEKVRKTLRQHFFNTQNGADQDVRHQVVFGVAFYAHDVFITNAIYRSALTIVGRVNLRILLEAYFNLAYMLHEEKKASNTDIWTKYRDYGAGRFTSIYKKLKSSRKRPPRLLNVPLIESIANEDKWNELREINYGDWRGKNLKKISKEIGQKELYDRYYEYLSDYVHVTWGSVRKSSMQKCCNILHRGHIIPSETMVLQLSSVTDCKRIMNKVLKLVDDAYPGLEARF